MHSVGRFLRLALFPVDRRRRWGLLRLNPYCYERFRQHQEFQRSCFHTVVPDSQVFPTAGQRFWHRLVGFVPAVSASLEVRVLYLTAGEGVKWKRSRYRGTSSHDLLQKRDIHRLLFISRSPSDPSDSAGVRCLWLTGKRLLCSCARWHGQLSVCVPRSQQLGCFWAISSILVTLPLLIIQLKLQRFIFLFLNLV